ncbi:RsmE family RNA methyltransferase [Aciditerrimonas ferrireducens]|uniref:Ribosomal RNA small subunit methyltransferase E n=1 Tax=Aciditerrimonas ferrireducens TaxID=667306 RepID=A0ABV6BZZ2_9ACTN|nr:RsmE family RNA methyltransferase [Aciditerrimonas ferrireducens]MCK4176502.1 16S rRNA (uracil(1498)-N(3))-methyltransferase [Aciditerrimonas ferrireducens]
MAFDEGRWPASAGASAAVLVDDLGEPALGPDGQHHLARVLRLAPGSPVVALDGRGGWRRCRLAGEGSRAGLEPDGPMVWAPRLHPELTVGLPPVKGERTEWAVQKLTELGVDRIVLLRTQRGVVRVEGQRAERYVARLRRVAEAALCQSRGAWLPAVLGPMSLAELDELLGAEGQGPAAVCVPGAAGVPSLAEPAVLVGPEGGFVVEELLGPRGQPRAALDLGPTILRVETAAVAVASRLCGLRFEAEKERGVTGAVPPPGLRLRDACAGH